MKSPFRTLYTCPYCRSPDGVVALDMRAVDNMSKMPHSPINLDMLESPSLAPFVFDSSKNRPCPHLLDFYIDFEVNLVLPGQKFQRTLDVSLNGTVAPLLHGKFGKELEIWTWENFVNEVTPQFAISTSYVVGEIRESLMIPGPKRKCYIQGTLIVAERPDAFLAELLARYEQSVATA